MSHLIEAGEYNRVLIVSSEVGSLGSIPSKKESFELFSDGAAAFIFQKVIKKKGSCWSPTYLVRRPRYGDSWRSDFFSTKRVL